jgi:hypothetical protein
VEVLEFKRHRCMLAQTLTARNGSKWRRTLDLTGAHEALVPQAR